MPTHLDLSNREKLVIPACIHRAPKVPIFTTFLDNHKEQLWRMGSLDLQSGSGIVSQVLDKIKSLSQCQDLKVRYKSLSETEQTMPAIPDAYFGSPSLRVRA
jgi:hypothetical protein